ATEVVVNNRDIPGAFTRAGFKMMKEAMLQPASHITSEDWVLGKTTAAQLDAVTLQQGLEKRYYKEFIETWRSALASSRVLGYASYQDAETKLGKLAGPSSPLLQLLWFVSQNTDVGVP